MSLLDYIARAEMVQITFLAAAGAVAVVGLVLRHSTRSQKAEYEREARLATERQEELRLKLSVKNGSVGAISAD